MKTGILIQCRLSSSRLPGKVLKPLYKGLTITDIIAGFLKEANFQALGEPVHWAYIIPDDEPELAAYLNEKDIPYFAGHPTNVLDRYLKAAGHFGLESIVRLTADNPFYDKAVLQHVITTLAENKGYDYFAVTGMLLGTAGESFRLGALQKQTADYQKKLVADDYEHVSIFMKKNPELFTLKTEAAAGVMPEFGQDLPTEEERKNLRFTCDLQSDFYYLQRVAAEVKDIYNASNTELLQVARKLSGTK